ncbi:MAG: AMP-binding protein [Bacteroidota bacterium]
MIHKIRALGLRNIANMAVAVYRHGFTLLALLDAAQKDDDAIIQDDVLQVSYNDLYLQAVALAYHLNKTQHVAAKSRVAIVSANSIGFVKSLFAASGLGADIFLLNPNQTTDYYEGFLSSQKIDLIIGHATLAPVFASYGIPFFCYDEIISLVPQTTRLHAVVKRKKSSLVILSSGSKGSPKAEKRKVSAIKYLNPLVDIIRKLHLKENRSVLISVPIFHGYGLAALLLAVFMGQKIRLAKKFDAAATLTMLQQEKTDCWIAVPLMLQKVYALKDAGRTNVKNIITGGDVLPATVVRLIKKTGVARVYNMYGTSETGVCTIATPNDLERYPDTIGQAITGIKTRIANAQGNAVAPGMPGMLLVKCPWSSDDRNNFYVPTGDLVTINKEGYYFYKGRQDDMMVIGGENIYPIELENIMYRNAAIQWAKIKSITHTDGRAAIHADVVMHTGAALSKEAFITWLSGNVPGYMVPKSITLLDEPPVAKLM